MSSIGLPSHRIEGRGGGGGGEGNTDREVAGAYSIIHSFVPCRIQHINFLPGTITDYWIQHITWQGP